MARLMKFDRFLMRSIAAVTLAGSSVVLAGCVGPTYGTDKTATEQLFEDLGSSLALGKKPGPKIDYSPRPDLVKPANPGVLPAPQESVVEQQGAWPESPEQRRARVRAEIDEGKTDPNFIKGGASAAAAVGASEGPARQGPPGAQRTYLTDPPTEYRVPAATAEYGDVGESEAKKARRLKKASGDGKTGWRRLVPWL